ncbi:MAG: DMT family transporter [Pseudomonadota bacterium]
MEPERSAAMHGDASQVLRGHAQGRQKLLGHLAALLFSALIAGSFSIGHLAAPLVEPAALNAARFSIAVGIIFAIYLATRRALPPIPKALWRFAILGALMATYFILMFVALRITTPVATGAVFTLIPLMSAGFGWLFLRQTTPLLVFISLVIAGTGAIWVIFRGDLEALLGLRIGAGEAIFFIGCAAHAAYAPLVRKFNRGETGLQFTLLALSATLLCIAIYGANDVASTSWTALPIIVWAAIFYTAIFATAATFFLLQFASMRLPASKVLSYGYLTPSFVILIEGAIGHGWPSMSILAGATLTAAALLVMAFAADS